MPPAESLPVHPPPLRLPPLSRNPNAIVEILKGKKLKPYRLTLFHSIVIEKSPADVALFEKAVLADGSAAADAQVVKARNGLVACYYQLPPGRGDPDGPNRFILFRKDGDRSTTLIYLEGRTELDQPIKLFINKKR